MPKGKGNHRKVIVPHRSGKHIGHNHINGKNQHNNNPLRHRKGESK